MPRRRDPDRLQSEIEELFADLWQVPRFAGLHAGFRPQVDCFRTENPPTLTVIVELPGVDPDQVDAVVRDRALHIAGERAKPRVEGAVYQQMEIEYGPFKRQIQLEVDVDVKRASATYDRGLLTIVLPIAKRPSGPVKVPIKVRSRP